jgi:hypothetical protein
MALVHVVELRLDEDRIVVAEMEVLKRRFPDLTQGCQIVHKFSNQKTNNLDKFWSVLPSG